MTNELTGLALREAVARALGWKKHEWEWTTSPHPLMGRAAHCLVMPTMPIEERKHWCIPNDEEIAGYFLPKWDESLDTCFAPGGPVERLHTDGYYSGMDYEGHGRWTAYFTKDDAYSHWQTARTPAEAICRAFLKAVEEPHD